MLCFLQFARKKGGFFCFVFVFRNWYLWHCSIWTWICDCDSAAAPGAWCIPRHGAWPNSLTLCVRRSTSRSSTTVSLSRRLAAVIRTSKSTSSTTTLRNSWSLIWRYVLCTSACVSLILQVPRKVKTWPRLTDLHLAVLIQVLYLGDRTLRDLTLKTVIESVNDCSY